MYYVTKMLTLLTLGRGGLSQNTDTPDTDEGGLGKLGPRA